MSSPESLVTDTTAPEPAPAPGDGAPTITPAREPEPSNLLGILGFVLSFFAVLNIPALVLCIVALVKSRRAGRRNGFALAGVIIAGIGVLITITVIGMTVGGLVDAAQTCARLGDGVHTVGNSTYTCTPVSFHVSSRF